LPKVILDTAIGPTKRVLNQGIAAFNHAHWGKRKRKTVAVSLREGSDILGGALGHLHGDTMFIELLWIDEAHRGQDYGTAIMDRIEEEARRLGASRVYLDTLSFQARPFYERRGYQLFGTLTDFEPGVDRYWLVKRL
jgi:GNAT superfamily N-acetyltransferase